jgi:diguanylate cyclase (GGDEF)-like protein
MNWLSGFFFGKADFPESEEFREFQYKFLILLQIFGAVTSGLYVFLGNAGALGATDQTNMRVILAHAILMAGFWLTLRGRKQLYPPIAWLTTLATIVDLFSSFILVAADEVRILWIVITVPTVFLVLGLAAGTVITVVEIVAIVLINPHVVMPLSPNALVTVIISMMYAIVFYHAYNGKLIYFFTSMRSSNDRLREMATRDLLTNVLNARTYYEICDNQISVAKRQRSPYSVLFIDLDHFKLINDTYGHAAGDIVLKSVANCLSDSLRTSDALGRVGGEEFSVFLPNTDTDGALALAESLRQNIEALMPSTGEQTLKITASIGVARNSHNEHTMLDIQKLADQAMYRAKAAGRNRVSSVHS